jgi:hypothetical protein
MTKTPNEDAKREQNPRYTRYNGLTVFDRFDKHIGTARPPGRIQADIVELGRLLTEFRCIAGGNWETWLKQEDWSDASARSYISICEWHSRCVNEALISGSRTPWDFELEDPLDLHALVHASTPEAAREDVIQRTGKLTSATVMAIIRKAEARKRRQKSRRS